MSPPLKKPRLLTRGTRIRLFVRLLSGVESVIKAPSTATVSQVLEEIQSHTDTPMITSENPMCLIYQGKNLKRDQTLEECGVGNDAELKLVCPLGSIAHREAWRLINKDLVPYIFSLFENTRLPGTSTILVRDKLCEFLDMWKEFKCWTNQLEILIASAAPHALVRLYMSSHRDVADETIRLLVSTINDQDVVLRDSDHPTNDCVLIVLEFCTFLGMAVGSHDPLYEFCRENLRALVLEGEEERMKKGLMELPEIFPFAQELAMKMSRDLVFNSGGPSSAAINDFTALLSTLMTAISGDSTSTFISQTKFPFNEELSSLPDKKKITYFRGDFLDLLNKFDEVLERVEEYMDLEIPGLSEYFTIFTQLNLFSKLYDGCKEIFQDTMKSRKRAVCYLIVKYAKRSIDAINWIFACKELMEFEAKRHVALMMLPALNYRGYFHMLIDRPQLLAESFVNIRHTHPDSLRAGLCILFRNERATGSGVLREWFVLVCKEIFNPQNQSRPDHFGASKVNPMHLQYFRFCGRVIALALMHEIHIGIALDRTFTLQLAGHSIFLEDIRDADPSLYNSCKKILEMDAEVVDGLGLYFVHEIEEFGEKKMVKLCVGGESMALNSKNMMQYVESLIQQRFVTSIRQQVRHFARGFADIASIKFQKAFFEFMDPEDLDRMLRGSENSISVDDWKAHTDYHGFETNDSQISWFWETVGFMSQEQKQVLLFFWTSMKYLPIEGFGGLASRLQIHKTGEPSGHLPTSHTCVYQLCMPSYPSLSVTCERLNIITQEHVGRSFGLS